jgi:hypothetical protein
MKESRPIGESLSDTQLFVSGITFGSRNRVLKCLFASSP